MLAKSSGPSPTLGNAWAHCGHGQCRPGSERGSEVSLTRTCTILDPPFPNHNGGPLQWEEDHGTLVIKEVAKVYPNIRFRILDLPAVDGLQAVARGEVEFGINIMGSSDPELEFSHLADDPFVHHRSASFVAGMQSYHRQPEDFLKCFWGNGQTTVQHNDGAGAKCPELSTGIGVGAAGQRRN